MEVGMRRVLMGSPSHLTSSVSEGRRAPTSIHRLILDSEFAISRNLNTK